MKNARISGRLKNSGHLIAGLTKRFVAAAIGFTQGKYKDYYSNNADNTCNGKDVHYSHLVSSKRQSKFIIILPYSIISHDLSN